MQSASEAAPPRGRRRSLSVCAPLGALLGLVALLGVTWALLVPPWQSPDETWHYSYAQSLAERFKLPTSDTRLRPYSTDQSLADNAVGASLLAFYPLQIRPTWSPAALRDYRRAFATQHPSRTDGGGYNSEASNPPLVYLFDDIPYLVDHGGDPFSRLYSMQIWNVLLLLASVVGAWLLAGEVFGRRRLVQLVCAAVVGLVPQATFILTSINPDALLVALWTLATWMGARVVTRRARPLDVGVLCALTAAAILTKATGYALVPAVLVATLAGWRRRPRPERRAGSWRLAAAGATLAVPVIAWVAYTIVSGRAVVNSIGTPAGVTPQPFRVGQFFSYLWQFYLPRLGFMTPFRTTSPHLAVFDVWIREGSGVFGYADVTMPAWVYAVLGSLVALFLIAALAVVGRILLARTDAAAGLMAFFVVSFGALLVLLHVSDYRSMIAGDGPLLQGRYLLPALPLLGLAVALAIGRLPSRLRSATAGAVVASLLVLQVIALATVATTYYT